MEHMISGHAFFRVKDDLFFSAEMTRVNHTSFKSGRHFSCTSAGWLSFYLCIIHTLISLLTSCYRPEKTAYLKLPIPCLMPSRVFVEGNSSYITSVFSHIHKIIWELSRLLRRRQLAAPTLPPDNTLKKFLMFFLHKTSLWLI